MTTERPELGTIRRLENGRGLEYLAQQGASTKRGYWEVWEPVATHAIKNMRLPEPFRRNLEKHGFGGETLEDLLLAEGWLPPSDGGYIEQAPSLLRGLEITRDAE